MDGAYAHLAACYKRTTDHCIAELNGCLTPGAWLKSSCLAGCFFQESLTTEIEDAVVIKAFQCLYDDLSEQDRRKLAEELGKAANDPSLVGHILTGGAMALGSLTGFQIYIVATTTVGALTSALCITLPFVIYTGLTRAIGIALGPIGWTLLGVTVLFQLNRTNWSRLVPGVVYVSYIRHKLDSDK